MLDVRIMRMKTIGIIIGVLVLAVVALVLYPILAQGPRWPHPADWNPVLAECAHISDTARAGLYPEEKWGPAIRSLNPRFVRFENKRIDIVLSTGGIGDSWGFLIYPDMRTNAPSTDGARFRMIEPGVFTYK